MREFYALLNNLVSKALEDSLGLKDVPPFSWEIPRNKEFGDLALSLGFKLASKLKLSPLEVASRIKEGIEKSLLEIDPGIEKVEIAPPGFVNFFLKKEALRMLLARVLEEKEKFFQLDLKEKPRVLIEFVSANPTGPLSIAHGRQAVVGDVITRLLRFLGLEVLREYYINDVGRQIDLFVASVRERMKELKGRDFSLPEEGYKGEYLKDIARSLIDKGVSEDIEELYREVIEEVLKNIYLDLEKLGVSFDSWVSQRELEEKGKVKEVLRILEEERLVYLKDEALWFKSTLFGDDKDRVLLRSNSSFTYFSADIAYHRDKIERGYTELINLWGPDHHGYIPRMEAAVKALGRFKDLKDSLRFKILIIQLVKVKEQRMARREGTIFFLRELIEEAGKDATRFYYLLRKNSSPLEFDLDLARTKSMENPLYYIQYAYARISSILRNFSGDLSGADLALLTKEEEFSLIKEILYFRNVLGISFQQLEPYYIVEYLKSLSSCFHKFYERIRVLDKDKDLSRARLSLIEAVRLVLKIGLDLIGVEAPQKM